MRITRTDAGDSGARQATAEITWAQRLLQSGARVAVPLLEVPLRLASGHIMSAWRYVPGRTWSFEDAEAAGRELAALHRTRPLPGPPAPDLFDISTQMLVSTRSHGSRLAELVGRARSVYTRVQQGLPQVPCHGDPHFGNAVVGPAAQWCWIDLQDARMAPALHDVSIALSTLRHRGGARQSFLDAYGPVPGLTPETVSSLLWCRAVRTAIVKASSPAFADVNLEDLVGALEERSAVLPRG